MQHIRQVVAKEFDAVNTLIIDNLHSDVDMVENIGHYIVDAGGKRLRPLLSLLCGGATGGIGEQHIRLAAVIEYIHTATLLHDDVVDLSSLRRGMLTVNARWGNAPSVLVGDFLYSRAFQMLVTIGNMDVMRLLSDTTNAVAEGEVLQLTRAGDPDTDTDSYFKVIRDKTAVLFAAACEAGAILNGSNDAPALYDYGLYLGIAFQLVDDILDYDGDPATTGKNIGDDLAEGKPTLPLIYAMQNAEPADRERIARAIREKSADELDAIIDVVKSSGALDHCKQMATEYSQKALHCIGDLADSPYRQALTELADMALQRKS